MPRLHLFASLGLSLLLAAVLPAQAGEQDRVRQGVASGAYKPLATIIADIQRQHPGRVADVETKRGAQGQLQYEIKLITPEGRKQELRVDAATGQVLRDEDTLVLATASLPTLAAHLEQLERQTQRRVIEVEYERTTDGRLVYQLRLEPALAQTQAQRVLMDARTGALLTPTQPHPPAAAPIRPMPEMLRAIGQRFDGHVLEVELEASGTHAAYYELELRQHDGSTLELKVDAHTLAVLQHRIDDD